jgi:hypothetical protein
MRNFTRTAVILPTVAVLALLVPRAVEAAQLDPAHVPSDAKWVVHLDLELLCDSGLAEAYRDKRPEKVERFRNKMKDRYGIDPQEDLKGLTLFSDDYEPHSGAAILRANYDREKIDQGVLSKKGVKTNKWRDYTLYTWKHHKDREKGMHRHGEKGKHRHAEKHNYHDRNAGGDQAHEDSHAKKAEKKGKKRKRTVTAALVDDKTIVFAGSQKRVKAAIKLLKGDSESLEGKDSRLVADVPDGAFIYGAAIELQKISAHEKPFPILKQHEHVKLVVGERDGELFKHVTLKAKNEETAGQMKKAVEGLVALSELMTAEMEQLNALYSEVEVTEDGATVKVKWQGDTDDVVEAVEEACEKLKQRRHEKRKQHDDAAEEKQTDEEV